MPANTPNPQLGMAAGAGLGLVALGTVAPAIATGWALGSAYDYASDTVNLVYGLSKDAPNVGKSIGVGAIAGAFVPLGLPMTQFGAGVRSKVFAGAYNAGLAGTAAFGASSIFSPTQNPVLAGTLGTGSSALGNSFGAMLPKPVGTVMNQMIQIIPGPMQTAIESDITKRNSP